MLSPVNVVLLFYEQDIPVDEVSCVCFSVRHATENHAFHSFELYDFSKLSFEPDDILETAYMIEHDRIFILVHVISLFKLTRDQGVLAR